MEIIREEIYIEIVTKNIGETVEGFIIRKDRRRSVFYDKITQSSVGRLIAFVGKMRDRGFRVSGVSGISHNDDMRYHIVLRPAGGVVCLKNTCM